MFGDNVTSPPHFFISSVRQGHRSATTSSLHLKKHHTDNASPKETHIPKNSLPYRREDRVPLCCLCQVAPAGGFPARALDMFSFWVSSCFTAGPQGLWSSHWGLHQPPTPCAMRSNQGCLSVFGRENRAQGPWVTLLHMQQPCNASLGHECPHCPMNRTKLWLFIFWGT